MKIFITGICGFAGSSLARGLRKALPKAAISGIDSLIRPGSEINRRSLAPLGISTRHGDIRRFSDLENLPPCKWIIDAAANPSVLAGVDGRTSSRQIIEHNLLGTFNLLELCRKWNAGFIMLSTSRVYSIQELVRLKLRVKNKAFILSRDERKTACVSAAGITENFPTDPPLSLYGSSKRCSEILALEYASAFHFPVFINRCGILAGTGQFGRADQGVFSFWIHAYRRRLPLQYIGFKGRGFQVRDCLHPNDLAELVARQIKHPDRQAPSILNIGGGLESSMSLAQLSEWCAARFGRHRIGSQPDNRPFDIPWLVLDNSRVQQVWGWMPKIKREAILEEIARHAETHPDWLDLSAN